jgi:hypothetical protein
MAMTEQVAAPASAHDHLHRAPVAVPARDATHEALGDPRFRALLGGEAWARLPPAVRRRFCKRLAGGRTVTYVGQVLDTRMTRLGWLIAQLARLIGGPLPIRRDALMPATVSVTEGPSTGGQIWTRVYGRPCGFPQVIHSAKRFAGRTGLEEFVGHGVGMALTIDTDRRALHFRSHHYFLEILGLHIDLPRWLGPGQVTVSHVECCPGWFLFVLDLRHALLGQLIHQTALFTERAG